VVSLVRGGGSGKREFEGKIVCRSLQIEAFSSPDLHVCPGSLLMVRLKVVRVGYC
jgi:hypothetical protein